MSESEELDEIRERKLAELREAGERATEPIHIDGADEFEETVASHPLVLVDFHADWCGPCKMMEPTLAELAAEGDLTVAKVDVDANNALAASYDVRGIPLLLLFADGELVERLTGVQQRDTLDRLVEQYA